MIVLVDLCGLNSLNHRGLPKQSQINIYTDGSKTKNHAGAGIAIIKHGNLRHTESIKLKSHITIFQAEAKAICEAARWFRLSMCTKPKPEPKTDYLSKPKPKPKTDFCQKPKPTTSARYK